MAHHVDLGDAGHQLLSVVARVHDDQLGRPTPCEGRDVGQLLQHLVGLTGAFRASADKDFGPWTDTDPDEAGWPTLEPGWRDTISTRVPALVEAWRSPEAWQGTTRAGGLELPAEVAGLVALDELVLHGWDLAVATGQDYVCDDATAEACLQFVGQFDEAGTPGLFGPAVPVAGGVTPFERVLARSGRDPRWAPA
jgi:uncharacterized protein (TIGR03086 family)